MEKRPRKGLISWPTRGIWVVNSVYNWGGAAADTAADPVKKTKDHPAILMWTIGRLAPMVWCF